MNIMHITEALGGGVLNVIQQLARLQSESGHKVTLVHSIRPDTPSEDDLNGLFPQSVNRIMLPMVTHIAPYQDLLSLIRIVKIIHKYSPDVIHLHSSKVGILGRIACRIISRSKSCFYTPHGYSFLKIDVSKSKRFVFLTIERVISFFGGTTVACSQSELDHAVKSAWQHKSILIENSIPLGSVKKAVGSAGATCLVATAGRICFQKNPSSFRDLACALIAEQASFLWIGDGELKSNLYVGDGLPTNMKVTGWVARDEVADLLHTSDLFVMSSLWEGMPLALIEAQASGLPAIVPNVEGCRDVVMDGVTGYVCNSFSEMVEKTKLLVSNVDLRLEMGKAARKQALVRFSEQRMYKEMMLAYENRGGAQVRPNV